MGSQGRVLPVVTTGVQTDQRAFLHKSSSLDSKAQESHTHVCFSSRILRIWNPEGTTHSKRLDCQSPESESGKAASYPLKGPGSSRCSKAKPGTSVLETSGRAMQARIGSPGSFQPQFSGDPSPALPAWGCFGRRPDG